MIEYILAATAVNLAGAIFDAAQTEAGLKKGLALEGNSLVDKLFGTKKPTAIELYVYNFMEAALITGLTILGYAKGTNYIPYVALGGGVATLVLDGLKHVQGGLQWRYLLKGGMLDVDGFPMINGKSTPHSALSKFIGPWLW